MFDYIRKSIPWLSTRAAQPPVSSTPSAASQAADWAALSDDLLMKIFAKLPARELLQVTKVATGWRLAANDPGLWRRQAVALGVSSEGNGAKLRARCQMAIKVSDNIELGLFSAKRSRFEMNKISRVTISPDGTKIVVGNNTQGSVLLETTNGAELSRFGHASHKQTFVFSPNSRMLAYRMSGNNMGGGDAIQQAHGGAPTLRLWSADDPEAGRYLLCAGSSSLGKFLMSWSPDGAWLAFASEGRSVAFESIVVGASLRPLICEAPLTTLAWSSDVGLFAAGCADGLVRLMSPLSGHEVARVQMASPVRIFAFSGDASTYLTVSQNAAVTHHHVVEGRPNQPLVQPDLLRSRDPYVAASLNGDGSRAMVRDRLSLIEYYDLTTQTKSRIHQQHWVQAMPAWEPIPGIMIRPDAAGPSIADLSNPCPWEAKPFLTHAWRKKNHFPRLSDVAVSPDGTKVLTAMDNGQVNIWDFASRAQLTETRYEFVPRRVFWTADGSRTVAVSDRGVLAISDFNLPRLGLQETVEHWEA